MSAEILQRCFRCGRDIKSDAITKRYIAENRRVHFHNICWKLIVDSSAEKAATRLEGAQLDPDWA